jgi:hypothetical protein
MASWGDGWDELDLSQEFWPDVTALAFSKDLEILSKCQPSPIHIFDESTMELMNQVSSKLHLSQIRAQFFKFECQARTKPLTLVSALQLPHQGRSKFSFSIPTELISSVVIDPKQDEKDLKRDSFLINNEFYLGSSLSYCQLIQILEIKCSLTSSLSKLAVALGNRTFSGGNSFQFVLDSFKLEEGWFIAPDSAAAKPIEFHCGPSGISIRAHTRYSVISSEDEIMYKIDAWFLCEVADTKGAILVSLVDT